MKNKIIKYLQEEKTVINVRSEKQWIELMEYFEFYNVYWQEGEKATSFIIFNLYNENTTIAIGYNQNEKLSFGEKELNKEEGFDVILFKEFKKEFIEKDISYQLHLAKKHVEALEKQLREETKKYYVRFKLKENDLNYLKYDKNEETYGIASNWANQNHKSKFTQKELQDLNVWDNPLFEIEEVE